MKEFENIKQKIQEFADKVDSERGVKLEEEIASVQDEIEQAKVSAEQAADNGKANDFQKYAAQQAMLSHKLEKLKAEQTATIYPPISALEYGNIKNKLKDTMLKIKAEKYKKLLKVLDQGQEVIHELEAAIKEYNSTHQELQYLINGSDNDSEGNEYRLFGITDTFSVDKRLTDIFCESQSIHCIRCYLENDMNRI